MATGQEQSSEMTVGEFIEMILAETDVGEAGAWLDHYIKDNDDSACKCPRPKWAEYCQKPLNPKNAPTVLQDLAYIFQSQIAFSMKWDPKRASHTRAQGVILLRLIYEKAREIVPGIREEDFIWLPGVEVARSAISI